MIGMAKPRTMGFGHVIPSSDHGLVSLFPNCQCLYELPIAGPSVLIDLNVSEGNEPRERVLAEGTGG